MCPSPNLIMYVSIAQPAIVEVTATRPLSRSGPIAFRRPRGRDTTPSSQGKRRQQRRRLFLRSVGFLPLTRYTNDRRKSCEGFRGGLGFKDPLVVSAFDYFYFSFREVEFRRACLSETELQVLVFAEQAVLLLPVAGLLRG